MDLLKTPKGTRDLAGSEAAAFTRLEAVARDAFQRFDFSEIRTPIFESAELFSRSLGQTSDVVEKEMFTFADRGERTYALRPEGTAGVARHFIENNLAMKGGFHRFFYSGPMFRAERPQAGRYRQFWQIGAENFGPADAVADADMVLLAGAILMGAGLARFSVQVNSIGCRVCRAAYREKLLAYLKTRELELTEESRRRMATNPMRVLDSKVDGPKLLDAPAMIDFLCVDCRAHHDLFRALLRNQPFEIVDNPRLVRGLDYYTRSVFEFVSPDLGAQSAVAAGGRYDDLVQELGGPSVPAVGFALGMDRVVIASGLAARAVGASRKAIVIPLDDNAVPTAFAVAQELRAAGIAVPSPAPGKKLKTQLSNAVDTGANWAILIGENELASKILTVKDLSTREQSPVARERLVSHLASLPTVERRTDPHP